MTPNQRILQSITKPIVEAAKPAKEFKPDWTKIDPASLSADLANLYATMKEANRIASAATKAFNAALETAIDPADGEAVLISHQFGNLSLAIVPAAQKHQRKAKAPVTSLADYLAKA